MEDNYVLLATNYEPHQRLLYARSWRLTEYMKLVASNPEATRGYVSLSDGELFLVTGALCGTFSTAPPRQPVSPHQIRVSS